MVRAGSVAALGVWLLGATCGLAQSGRDRFFDSDGVRLRYQVTGQGPPVVLLHGFGETLERWEAAGVVRTLSPHFQVIAMDVRGHGQSAKPHDAASYGAVLAADVARLLRHLGASKAHVVGYSMGALVALDFAVRHQDHALSIVLGGAGLSPPEAIDDFTRQADAFEQGRVPLRAGDDGRALAALLRATRLPSEQEVRAIAVPLTALVGANDRFVPNVRRLSRVLPDMTVVTIPDTDHATAMNDPRFAAAMLAFLRQQPTPPREKRSPTGR